MVNRRRQGRRNRGGRRRDMFEDVKLVSDREKPKMDAEECWRLSQ